MGVGIAGRARSIPGAKYADKWMHGAAGLSLSWGLGEIVPAQNTGISPCSSPHWHRELMLTFQSIHLLKKSHEVSVGRLSHRLAFPITRKATSGTGVWWKAACSVILPVGS